ncbi:phosphoribosylpyrophosphate synthetase [Sphingomonas sp. Root710]|uniref:ribose-phosphate diphosphokinase n=1 Tax=Sphingomonas sp. Root710 TaxID=1736594 RepID=UPI0006FE1A7E|nr:ribose-phosphate diphosphokinase [Sphingomonas sp. Root710]KRB81208.1 phosphoribosylpyrophosphate synthetase [Sphingomonas sp. Root710]
MTIVCGLPGNEAMAQQLATILEAQLGHIESRRFPDGESYVRFEEDVDRKHVVLVCTLAHPDSQILRLLFAADAARDLGARMITLVAPYLAYMRQDRRFRSGEAISSRSFARVLSGSFDRIVTVSPHLHRYKALSDLYPVEALALDAAPLLAAWLASHVARPLLVGPDSESEQWVGRVARLAGAPYVVGRKLRSGDRDVSVELPGLDAFAGRHAIIVDDVISSGATVAATAGRLRAAGFARIGCLAVHGLQSGRDTATLLEKVDALVTTDSVANDHGAIGLAPLIAEAVAQSAAASLVV